MKYHIYDTTTKFYLETKELDAQPENSASGNLPEQTEFYTLAYIDNEWVSVVRPEYIITENGFEKLKQD